MLTKDDIQQIAGLILASENRITAKTANKDDIKDMVVKNDIRDMATKQDLIPMATKKDIYSTNEKIEDLKSYMEINNKVLHTIFKVEIHDQSLYFWKQFLDLETNQIFVPRT